MPAFLHAFAHHLPARAVSNEEIAAKIGKPADWIENASGIRERRWADPETGIADLGLAAAKDCLRKAGMEASEVGMLLSTSGSGAVGFPGPGAEIADRLGIGGVPVIDLPVASAGSLFGIALAMRMVEFYGDILIVAAEKMSPVIEAHELDPNTAMLFGDGAGAVLVSARPGRWELLDAAIHSDGAYRTNLAWDGVSALKMDGLTVILQASRKMPSAIQEVLQRQQIAVADVGVFLLHQANWNLLKRVAKALGVAEDRVFANISRYGNTSSASMLIAASEWADSDAGLSNAAPIVFSAFGAGFHWGAAIAASRSST